MNTYTVENIPDISSPRVSRPVRQRRTGFNPVLAFKYELPGELMLTRGKGGKDRKPKSTNDLYVYLVNLARREGHCSYSNIVLAEAMEVGERTISRALMWLKNHCYITEGWVRMPSGWIERWLYPTKMADVHLKIYREHLGYESAILPIVRSSKRPTKRSVPTDQTVVSFKVYRGKQTAEAAEGPQTPSDEGASESFSAGMSEPAAPPEMPVTAETEDAEVEDDDDGEDGTAPDGKQRRGPAWIADIRANHQDLATALKVVFPDFDWEGNAPMARKFVKAVERGALSVRAVLLLKLHLRNAFEERDAEGNDGTWSRPKTFVELMKRKTLDRTIQLCFEEAMRMYDCGSPLATPETEEHSEESRRLQASCINMSAEEDPIAWANRLNLPVWCTVWMAHMRGHRFTAPEKQAVAAAVLSTLHRSSINNVVATLERAGRTVEDTFFMPRHLLITLQNHREKLVAEHERQFQIIFGGAS